MFVIVFALSLFAAARVHAQTQLSSAFTYQGELADAGTPVTGTYDIRFRLYDAATGGNQIGGTFCSDNLTVTGGRFAASLDFGPAAFSGQRRYLEIEVRQDSGLDCLVETGYTLLTPRQELTATPHASFARNAGTATSSLTAANASSLNGQLPSFYQDAGNLTGTLPSARLSGTYTGPLVLSNPSNIFTGDGAAIMNLSATNISAGVLDAERMPMNWAAGGDLTGFFPSPTISAGAVSLTKLAPSLQGTFSKLSFAVPTPSDAVAWGFNGYGQTDVPTLPPDVTYTAVAAGYFHNLALRSNGTLVAWGDNTYQQSDVPSLPAGVTYTAAAGGYYHSLGLRSDGTVVAWGNNGVGQCTVPALTQGVTYSSIAAANSHSLALRSDGRVAAWGDNNYLQLNVPALPSGVTYTAVALGYGHSLALRSDGMIAAWGLNDSNQTIVPALPQGTTYVAVSAGFDHSLGLRSDGTVAAWGRNFSGETNVPALPPGMKYIAVSGGESYSLALRSDGTVVSWGYNGDGRTDVPALPRGVTYTAVAAGRRHGLAMRSGVHPTLDSSVGLSIGSPVLPPAAGGISVVGDSSFAAGVRAASFYGSGAGLTDLRAANVSGVLSAALIPDIDASKITSGTLSNARTTGNTQSVGSTLVLRDAFGDFGCHSINASSTISASSIVAQSFFGSGAGLTNLDASRITAGFVTNNRTTGDSRNTASTLVLRDASGNFSAGTVTAVLNGNATTATNAAQLNGQAASFYTNASNITSGTLATAQIPNLDASKITTGTLASAQVPNLDASKITTGTLADARLSTNIAFRNAANSFTSTGVTSFAGNVAIGTTIPDPQYALQAVSGGDTQIGLTGGPATGGAIPPRTWSIQSSGVNSTPASLNGTFQIIDRTGNASRLLIDTTGNVGIGTSTPSQKLTVAGNMNVTGSISKGGGSFKIDHPLDPENKYLYHSFVESPDMMNIYNGVATTDERGLAVVELPEYFEALNRDFRYQLTVVDDSENDFILAKVYRKIGVDAPLQFTIRTSVPHIEVSWQVTGIRKDAWAEKNRIPNSVDKVGAEKGKFLHPEAFGKPVTQGVYFAPDSNTQPVSK